ncbi:MAG: hypothetical protein FJ278_18050, partial [Planctomycetes bacterium]|nr:hypothetical protein [Planctomycetota bacterium]
SASNVALNPGISDAGFYRLNLAVAGDGWKNSRSIRLAVVQPFDKAHPGADGFLGINHAFVSDLFMRRARAMGVTWVRSWFAKWQDVEREKGRFDFAEADLQMQWLKRMGCHVLLCLSDPSNEWASTAPTDLKDHTREESQSRRVWWLPKSFDDYERYVQEVAKHFDGQVRHYEVFNEPTDPKGGQGCNLDMGRNYATFVQRARSGARAVSKDNLIFSAGLHYLKPIPDLRPVLNYADVLSEHWYPGLAPTESFARNIGLSRKAMGDAGCLRPIWITEYGIYADDDPDPTTAVSKFTVHRGKDSERLVATYAVKHHVIALANGVEKVFYHIGNWPFMLNREHGCCFHPFFEWGGAPRKAYVALNALATRLPPGTRFVRSRKGENALFAFEFAAGDTHTAILWAEGPASFAVAARKALADAGIRFFDVAGAKQSELPAEPPDSPLYLVATGRRQQEAVSRFLDDTTAPR